MTFGKVINLKDIFLFNPFKIVFLFRILSRALATSQNFKKFSSFLFWGPGIHLLLALEDFIRLWSGLTRVTYLSLSIDCDLESLMVRDGHGLKAEVRHESYQ